MILCFPNYDTLRLALLNGAVPMKLASAPVQAGFDDEGRIWLQPAADPARGTLSELDRLGVKAHKKSPVSLDEEAGCWPQLFPIERAEGPPAVSEKTPILFELPPSQLSAVVSEMLRLGNDRQSVRYLEQGEAGRVLLRVIGPPYYTLLRALDTNGQAEAPLAYVESTPRVWVQLGHRHPLMAQLKAPAGQMVLLRPPRQWTWLKDEPFRDIYEIVEFDLPFLPASWSDAERTERLTVPLRLGQGAGTDVAELWVLREHGFEQLDTLVREANDELLARLDFAVGESDGQQVIVLRVRPSKAAPPVLVLRAVAFRPHPARLPNLYLPCGRALLPPLRRDAVRRLLAEDPAVITWLRPEGDHQFVPETLPDSAFRPLSAWIDYVLEHDRKPLEQWVQSSLFDFEPFICSDDVERAPRPPRADKQRAGPRPAERADETAETPEPTKPVKKPRRKQESEDPFIAVAQPEAGVQERQRQLAELEDRFRNLEGALDSDDRQQLWPELAELNASLGRGDDAGLCWLSAFWNARRPPAAWTWQWLQTEAGAVVSRPVKGQARSRSWAELPATPETAVDAADLDRLLALPEPASADLRTLVAYLVWAEQRTPHPPAVVQRLNALRQFVEKHEYLLPVRAVWLAWVSLTRLSHGDVLALARARDRLLERLFEQGLKPDQDLPGFLRFAGQASDQRSRNVRHWLATLNGLAQQWLERMPPPVYTETRTAQYIDLMFAFGLARLGEQTASRRLLDRAVEVLDADGHPAHSFLMQAFAYRISEAMAHRPHTGPLPTEYMEELARLQAERKKTVNDVNPDYVIDRMRWLSRILEPAQKVDPYRETKGRRSKLDTALAELPDILDRTELAQRINELLQSPPGEKDHREARARVLRFALDQAPRAGEGFALHLLQLTPAAVDALPESQDLHQLEQRTGLLEKGLFVAAHFDHVEIVQELVVRFEQLLESPRGTDAVQWIDGLVGQCFRGLRKLGMRDVIDRLMRKLASTILEGRRLDDLDATWASKHLEGLQALVHVAAGWYYFSRNVEAETVLRVARELLFGEELNAKGKAQLACAYAAALGQAPVELAQRRLEELFHRLSGIRDTFGVNKYFGWLQLQVVEAVVRAVVSDDFLLGADARRWLDDDEFLVRRRIHQDVRTMLNV